MKYDGEERRIPAQNTVDNTLAIGKLTAISERTTKDIDRLVMHIEKILPVHEVIIYLKKLIYACVAISVMFASWITLSHFQLKEKLAIAMAARVQLDKADAKERIYNKNQIQYLNGVVKQ